MKQGMKYNKHKTHYTHQLRSKISEKAFGALEYIASYEGVTISQMVRIFIMHEMKYNPKYKALADEYYESLNED